MLHIKESISGPWAIIGDFNEILYPHKIIGGNKRNTSRMQDFGYFIDNCHLLDLESFGLSYTWFNKRKDSVSIFEKLDWFLINEQWGSSIKDSRVKNPPIIGPDHGPIVLHLEKRIWESEEFWFHILGFSDIVKEAWSFHFAGSDAF